MVLYDDNDGGYCMTYTDDVWRLLYAACYDAGYDDGDYDDDGWWCMVYAGDVWRLCWWWCMVYDSDVWWMMYDVGYGADDAVD